MFSLALALAPIIISLYALKQSKDSIETYRDANIISQQSLENSINYQRKKVELSFALSPVDNKLNGYKIQCVNSGNKVAVLKVDLSFKENHVNTRWKSIDDFIRGYFIVQPGEQLEIMRFHSTLKMALNGDYSDKNYILSLYEKTENKNHDITIYKENDQVCID